MDNSVVGKKIYITDKRHPHYRKLGEVTYLFSSGHLVTARIGDERNLFRADQFALVPLAGDRVRLVYENNWAGVNGATGTVGEVDETVASVTWDTADHVAARLRGRLTWEAIHELSKVEGEPAIEKPTSVAAAVNQLVAATVNEQVEPPTPQPPESPFWRAASRALQLVASKRTYFTTDDVWAKLKRSTPEGFNIDPRAMGALMVQAEKLGFVLPTKRSKPSTRSECHRRPIRIWKVTPTGKTNALAVSQIQP